MANSLGRKWKPAEKLNRWFGNPIGSCKFAPRFRNKIFNATIAIFCLGLMAVIWGALLTELSREREYVLAKQVAENDNLIQLFAKHVERILAAADITLLEVEHEYAEIGKKIDLKKYLHDRRVALSPFKAILVIDDKNNVATTNFSIKNPISAARTPNAKHHKLNASREVFVANPRMGKAN